MIPLGHLLVAPPTRRVRNRDGLCAALDERCFRSCGYALVHRSLCLCLAHFLGRGNLLLQRSISLQSLAESRSILQVFRHHAICDVLGIPCPDFCERLACVLAVGHAEYHGNTRRRGSACAVRLLLPSLLSGSGNLPPSHLRTTLAGRNPLANQVRLLHIGQKCHGVPLSLTRVKVCSLLRALAGPDTHAVPASSPH